MKLKFISLTILLDSFILVKGWRCDSRVEKVFSRINSNAVLQFDLSRFVSQQTVDTLIVKFHNNRVIASVSYNNGDITYNKLPGVEVTADLLGHVEVTRGNVGKNDSGIYYISSHFTPTRCCCLYILGAPTNPIISTYKNPPVGGSVTLSCTSSSTTTPSNHSLGMRYSWRVDNVENPRDSRYSYSTNRNTLTLSNVVKADADKIFTCISTEDVSNGYTTGPSDTFSVAVIYGPDSASLIPAHTNYTVDEGSVLVNIKCTADCFPECSYRWTKQGQNVEGSSLGILSLGAVQKQHSGNYTCRATNTDTSQSVYLVVTVRVRYGPYSSSTVLSPSTQEYIRNEGDTDLPDIRCSADCFPRCTYSWTKFCEGKTTVIDTVAGVLSLASLNRFDAGYYTCTASNPGKAVSSETAKAVTVRVRYGPDKPSLSVSSPYTAIEGEFVSGKIQCSSDCYPGCSYTWRNVTNSSTICSDSTLLLGNVNRYMTGAYTCTATNIATEYTKLSESTLTIIVQYVPDVKIEMSTTNVTEGTELTLYCVGSGVPSIYTYTGWTQTLQGFKIPNRNAELSGTVLHTSIHFRSLHLQDTGTYICALNNGVRDTNGTLDQSASVNITVKVQPKVFLEEYEFTGARGDNVQINVPVYSYPDLETVNVSRYDDANVATNNKSYITIYPNNVKTKFYGIPILLEGSIIAMTIKNLEEDDFGSYFIKLTNGLGSELVEIFVIAKDSEESSKAQTLTAVAAGVSSSVVLAIAVALTVFLWKKRLSNNDQHVGRQNESSVHKLEEVQQAQENPNTMAGIGSSNVYDRLEATDDTSPYSELTPIPSTTTGSGTDYQNLELKEISL